MHIAHLFRIILRVDTVEASRHEDIGKVTYRGKSSAFTARRSERYARTQPRSHRRNNLSSATINPRAGKSTNSKTSLRINMHTHTRRPRLKVKQPRKKEAVDGIGKRTGAEKLSAN